ncbi:MAG TPA: choice-of-anchor tandem repeat GloVer-containing protein, partial [Arachidicoccus sp.]|nr:choice-of-anchor tandem repeat GloVer-containing protein [Arachidicoccus sp.]
MASAGGTNNYGTVFKLKLSDNSFTNIHDFDIADGSLLFGSLTIGDGYLYGMTRSGGVNGKGSIFKINMADNTYTTIYDLNDASGSYPLGSLIYDGTYLYGTAGSGGVNFWGTIFKLKPSDGSLEVLHSFNGIDGGQPVGSLFSDGTYLYGMSSKGGAASLGNVFKINKAGADYTVVHDFINAEGSYPQGSLVSDGLYLYGMTPYGGANTKGTIFKIKIADNNFTTLYDFNGTDGARPNGALTIAGTDLYGMTSQGGAATVGVLFKYQYSTVLPVIMQHFSGRLQDGSAHLVWETGVETGFNNFEVEESTDGNTFNSVARIAAKGSNSSYTYDTACLAPTVYFRLKIMNTDGSSKNSDVVKLMQNTSGSLLFYPNPAKDYFSVSSPKAGKIGIYDASGRLVKQLAVQAGVNSIDIRNLPAGTYFAIAAGAKFRFIKQ